MEEFEAESRQSGEAVAFSVLLGDLNFDNCSQGNKLGRVEPRHPALPTKKRFSSTDHAKEQGHKFFSCFKDPCRLGPCQEQPWALGTILNNSTLHQSIISSPEMLQRALEQEKGRRLYLAGPLNGNYPAQSWKGRRLDYITYRGVPGSRLSPEAEQVTFSTAFAGLTDHLAMGLKLQVVCS